MPEQLIQNENLNPLSAFETFLNNVASAPGNDDEIETLRELCNSLFAELPPLTQALFLQKPETQKLIRQAERWAGLEAVKDCCETCHKELEKVDIDGGRCTGCGSMLLPKESPLPHMPCYEIVLNGFYGADSNTDHLVLWIKATNPHVLENFTGSQQFEILHPEGIKSIRLMDEHTWEYGWEDGVDYLIKQEGEVAQSIIFSPKRRQENG